MLFITVSVISYDKLFWLSSVYLTYFPISVLNPPDKSSLKSVVVRLNEVSSKNCIL